MTSLGIDWAYIFRKQIICVYFNAGEYEKKQKMNNAVKPIISIGEKKLTEPKEIVAFTNNTEWDLLINNLDSYSHLFVLGCVGDKQIKAEKAWAIPIQIGKK